MKAIVLFSAGVDSTLAFLQALKDHKPEEILTLFFNYGQRAGDQEYSCVCQFLRDHGCTQKKWVEIPLIEEGSGHYMDPETWRYDSQKVWPVGAKKAKDSPVISDVPFRNFIFLSYAMSLAMTETGGMELFYIYTGFNQFTKHPSYDEIPLGVIKFLEGLDPEGLKTRLISVVSPFGNGNVCGGYYDAGARKKSWKQLSAAGVDFANIWSCENAFEKQCGVCSKCVENLVNLRRLKIKAKKFFMPIRKIEKEAGFKFELYDPSLWEFHGLK